MDLLLLNGTNEFFNVVFFLHSLYPEERKSSTPDGRLPKSEEYRGDPQ